MPTAFALRRRRRFRQAPDPRPPIPDGMMYWHGELLSIEEVQYNSRRRMGNWDQLPKALRIHLSTQPNEPNLYVTWKLNNQIASGVLLDPTGKPTKKRHKAIKLSVDDL